MGTQEDLHRLQERLKHLEAASGAQPHYPRRPSPAPGGLLDRCRALEDRLEKASSALGQQKGFEKVQTVEHHDDKRETIAEQASEQPANGTSPAEPDEAGNGEAEEEEEECSGEEKPSSESESDCCCECNCECEEADKNPTRPPLSPRRKPQEPTGVRRRALQSRKRAQAKAGRVRKAPVVHGEPTGRELRGTRRMRAGEEAAEALWRELRDSQQSWSKERVLLKKEADRQRRVAMAMERQLDQAERREQEIREERDRLKRALQERDRWIKEEERKRNREEQRRERQLSELKGQHARLEAQRDSLLTALRDTSQGLERLEERLLSPDEPPSEGNPVKPLLDRIQRLLDEAKGS